MTEVIIVAHNLELPYGARRTYKPHLPLETGALYLLTIGKLLTVGRYYRDIAGFDWITQPDLIIQVDSEIAVEIWGLIVPVDDPSPDRSMWSGISAASIAIIDLAIPFMA